MSRACVVAVDLGGTNVRAAAYFEDGTPAGERFEAPSRADEGLDAVAGAVVGVARMAADATNVNPQGIGMAVPGHIDDAAGLVRWAPNFGETVDGLFRHWVDVPLKSRIAHALGLPVWMQNDANLAALGEYRYGSGRNSARCLMMLTLGTGIGGGVVLSPSAVAGQGRGPLVLLGGNLGGAELGHTLVQIGGADCPAGTAGSLEAYCRRDAIVRRAVRKLQRGRSSLVRELSGGDLAMITPRLLSEASERGDELAIEVWEETGTYLGAGIGSLINVFAPDVVAIGGQIAKAGEVLLEAARRAARETAIPTLYADANIVPAERVDDAGLLGAAAHAFESTLWNPTT